MRITIAVACALILLGCARDEPTPEAEAPPVRSEAEPTQTPDPASPASVEPLPAKYSGVLPCADCPGIRYDVDLRPSNVFFLRMTYLDTTTDRSPSAASAGAQERRPERSYDDIGTWSVASDLHTLALRGARQAPLLFSIIDDTTLRKLDNEGQPIESELNYVLNRDPAYAPLAPQVPLRGMFAVTNEGAVINECTTGLKLRLEGGPLDDLAKEFEAVSKGRDRPILLAVEGRVDVPDSSSTAGQLTSITSTKFWPGESCGARGVTHDLEGSRWVLVRLGDRPVVPQEGRPEPYIVLQAATKQIAGHGGCNRLSGGYEIKGEMLQFGELTTTRMACPEIEIEHALLSALDRVARWRLTDNQLVLLDTNNTALLQLESRNL